MKRARYRVVYKSGKSRKTGYYVATSAEVTPINEDTCVLELREEGQTVMSMSYDLVYLCELVEFLGPEGGVPTKPTFIRPKSRL